MDGGHAVCVDADVVVYCGVVVVVVDCGCGEDDPDCGARPFSFF